VTLIIKSYCKNAIIWTKNKTRRDYVSKATFKLDQYSSETMNSGEYSINPNTKRGNGYSGRKNEMSE